MAESSAVHSYGTTLGYSATSGGSYTAVAEILDLDEDFDVPEFKTTHLASDSGTHEYKPKMAEPGESTFRANFYAAQYATVAGLAYNRTQKWWKITTPEGGTAVFKGHIKKKKRSIPDDDRITYDITIKRTGPITFTGP